MLYWFCIIVFFLMIVKSNTIFCFYRSVTMCLGIVFLLLYVCLTFCSIMLIQKLQKQNNKMLYYDWSQFLCHEPEIQAFLSVHWNVKSLGIRCRNQNSSWFSSKQFDCVNRLLSPVDIGDKVEFDTVDFRVALAPYTLLTKSKGRLTFGQRKLPTFEYVQLWRQSR